ncbi:hypothetical protein [Microcoleus sp. Pol10D4]|uniref:hypothetical protein n=1 Tax=Microcoleus sp. Pol10D4 TaxID=3055387 RepID=UPI002FCFEFC0
MPAPKVKIPLVAADRQIRPISCQLAIGTLMPQVYALGGNSDDQLPASAAVQVLSGEVNLAIAPDLSSDQIL